MPTVQDVLQRAYLIPLALLGVYGVIVGLVMVPAVQRELVFLHRAKFPLFPRYNSLAYYGIAPNKGRDIRIETPDGETLGAWHILPHSFYLEQRPFPPQDPLSDATFDAAFASRPTVLYLHGNAATRAAPHRIRTYQQLSTSLDCNVIAIDYRGFADSTGVPSQEGVVTDARAAWEFITARIERMGGPAARSAEAAREIVILGHSLGTGIGAALTAELADEGVQPRALALLAPYSSMHSLLSSFWLFGVVPLLSPLNIVPTAQDYFKSHIAYPFNSREALSRTSLPTLILHAVDDNVIPSAQSEILFDSLLEPNGTAFTGKIETREYPGWGVIKQVELPGGPLVWWEGEHGGHENIGHAEGTMDLLGTLAKL